MNVAIFSCERCGAELEPGEPHPPDLCESLVRFRDTAVAHKNYGKERPHAAPKVVTPPAQAALEREPVGIERSLPPEREEPTRHAPHATPTLPHRDQEIAFAGSEEAHRRDKEVFAVLAKSFDGVKPGAWVQGEELEKVASIKRVNSSVSRIREWPLLAENRVDVDSHVAGYTADGKQIWEYRICRREDSERLTRERERRPGNAAKQSEFHGVEESGGRL